ncbi:hypothetical protein [Saccharothrix hoggarensis]|uniref:Uncharacterized protein n=1 Tax=Saccharothrix hoggarensis TaxID=913853 RepID=A0ABW3QU54_9PSEU
MVHPKASVAPVAASGGLLVLLLVGACGKPAASPEPVVLPTISSSSAPVTSIPAVAQISVRPVTTTTTPEPTTVAGTTEPPPPPPPPVQVQPQPAPPPAVTTTTPPKFDQVAIEGFPCTEEGATAIDPTGRDLVCERTRRNRLAWERA